MQGGGGGEKKDAAIIRAEEIELGKELGKGEFGEVLKGRWTRRGKDPIAVAVKTLRADAVGAGTAEFMREAEVMSSLEHDYVTRLLGVCLHPTMMIVQELVPHGALLGFVRAFLPILSGGYCP